MIKRTISFHRHYHGYTGGHQKVRDYLSHAQSIGLTPSLYLQNKAMTNQALFDDITNVIYQNSYSPEQCDIAFLAGMDWQAFLLSKGTQTPVINLIQHVRHGDAKEPLFQFLKYPAIRICVSEAVRQAVLPHSNGPCYTIKMGHTLPLRKNTKTSDIYILANKQPQLGRELALWAKEKGFSVELHDATTEKHCVHNAMASAHVTLALPHETEGFYLPGIEAMWASNMAVVPYCVANKEYYSVAANMLIPDYSEAHIKLALLKALKITGSQLWLRKVIGARIAKAYSLQNERKQFQNVFKKHFS